MNMTPADIRAASFKTGRKGYDTDEVRAYLDSVARQLEESGRDSKVFWKRP